MELAKHFFLSNPRAVLWASCILATVANTKFEKKTNKTVVENDAEVDDDEVMADSVVEGESIGTFYIFASGHQP
jgi:hypothetical protein